MYDARGQSHQANVDQYRSKLVQKFSRFTLLLAMTMASLATPYSHAANLTGEQYAALYDRTTEYTIFRKGKRIGKHTLTIETDNENITVAVDSRIKVTVLKVPVFRFRYESVEKWKNNALESVQSTTTTNKKVETASLLNSTDASEIGYNGNVTSTDRLNFATNHWHIGAVNESILFNTINGQASSVSVENRGPEIIQINGQDITANHYIYSGDITAESWYDESGKWVKLSFDGEDGSKIDYIIDTL